MTISLFVLDDHALAQKPCPGDHKICNVGTPFLGHHYYTLSLFDLCLGVEKKIV